MTECYYMKTSPRMKFTLDLTLQGKATYIFSSRCSGLCTPALQQPLAVTQWRISKVCFHMAHSKSRASGVKRVLHSTAGGFFFSYLFFFFFLQAVWHARGMDRSSDRNGSKARKSTAVNGDGAKSLPSRSDEETGAQPDRGFFITTTSTTGGKVGVNTPIINS